MCGRINQHVNPREWAAILGVAREFHFDWQPGYNIAAQSICEVCHVEYVPKIQLGEERFKLNFGPYTTPRFPIGQTVIDQIRGEVTIVGITDGLIPGRSAKRSGLRRWSCSADWSRPYEKNRRRPSAIGGKSRGKL